MARSRSASDVDHAMAELARLNRELVEMERDLIDSAEGLEQSAREMRQTVAELSGRCQRPTCSLELTEAEAITVASALLGPCPNSEAAATARAKVEKAISVERGIGGNFDGGAA